MGALFNVILFLKSSQNPNIHFNVAVTNGCIPRVECITMLPRNSRYTNLVRYPTWEAKESISTLNFKKTKIKSKNETCKKILKKKKRRINNYDDTRS